MIATLAPLGVNWPKMAQPNIVSLAWSSLLGPDLASVNKMCCITLLPNKTSIFPGRWKVGSANLSGLIAMW